jgi:hypothetical protein
MIESSKFGGLWVSNEPEVLLVWSPARYGMVQHLACAIDPVPPSFAGPAIGIGFFVMENLLSQAPAPLEAARVLLAVNLIISSNRDRSRTTASE